MNNIKFSAFWKGINMEANMMGSHTKFIVRWLCVTVGFVALIMSAPEIISACAQF